MIDGVKKINLVRHADDRGYVQELLRRDDPHFEKFGQVYVTTCRKGVIKAWHCHKLQTDRFVVVHGTSKIGLYDDRPDSPTRGEYNVFIIGDDADNALIVIPPMVLHGQMALSEVSYLINMPTEPYNKDNPDEIRKPISELKDIWTIKNR